MTAADTFRATVQLEDRLRRPAGEFRPDAWLDEERTADDIRSYQGVRFVLDEPLDSGERRDVDIELRTPAAWRPLVRGESFGLYEGHQHVATATMNADWSPAP